MHTLSSYRAVAWLAVLRISSLFARLHYMAYPSIVTCFLQFSKGHFSHCYKLVQLLHWFLRLLEVGTGRSEPRSWHIIPKQFRLLMAPKAEIGFNCLLRIFMMVAAVPWIFEIAPLGPIIAFLVMIYSVWQNLILIEKCQSWIMFLILKIVAIGIEHTYDCG
jgi:hypothetical protein